MAADAAFTRAAGSATLNPRSSWKTCAAMSASRSKGTVTSVLLMSPTSPVPLSRAAAIARRAAARISGAAGSGYSRRSAINAFTQALNVVPAGTR